MPLKLWVNVVLATTLINASHASILETRTANLPLVDNSWSVEVLGNGNDTTFNPYIYRDGGGGIALNGYNMIVFADTGTNCKSYNEGFCGFASNTAVYFGLKNKTNPLDWTDFGKAPVPREVVPFTKNETTNSTVRTLIWPDTRYVQLNDTHGLGYVSVGQAYSGTVGLINDTYLYNSLVYISMNDSGPTFTRIKPQFFYGSEVLYGTFSIERSGDFLYLFGYNLYGAKVARVEFSQLEDRSSYEYWNGSSWADSIPENNDPTTNVWNYTAIAVDGRRVGPLHGDCFIDNHHQSPMCIFTDGGVSGIFYATWSKTGSFEGPWYDPIEIFEPPHPPDPSTFTYGGHAYPFWDRTGKTLLLSYSWGGSLTQMASVTWDSPNATATSSAVAESTPTGAAAQRPLAVTLQTATVWLVFWQLLYTYSRS